MEESVDKTSILIIVVVALVFIVVSLAIFWLIKRRRVTNPRPILVPKDTGRSDTSNPSIDIDDAAKPQYDGERFDKYNRGDQLVAMPNLLNGFNGAPATERAVTPR